MLEVKSEELEISFPSDEPILYKLCRIDENGLARPTTEEELLEVESLIQAEFYEDDEHDLTDDEKEGPEETDDLEDVKRRLLKQLEVVDSMLLKVKTEEEDQRTMLDSTSSGYNISRSAYNTYKRRRRPNPKYYNMNAVESTGELPAAEIEMVEVKTEARPLLEDEALCSTAVAPASTVPAFTQQEVVFQAPPNKLCLDNLSIRELQDTYRDTFGRETSAKDKHWLKRKIAKGLSSGGVAQRPQDLAVSQDLALMERMDSQPSAEQPFALTDGNEDVKLKLLPAAPTTISPTASLDASTTTVVSRPSDGHSHEAQSLEGKRHRKPTRRYLEDEMETDEFGRISSSPEPEDQQQELEPEYTAPIYEENSDDDDADDFEDLPASPLDESLSPENSNGARKQTRGFGENKAERKAAQLVKMARNARAARREANNAVRKIKFKIPSAPSNDNDENYEPTEDSGEQLSCMLPTMSSDELQPSDTEDTENARKGSRRKHHRPWTLREVMALVDGVSRCGTGKWADIKRLAFSAIAYRTPVDLKDKWRNLLRASRVHSHSSRQQPQGEKRRKHFSVSIPAPILARVRELAAQPGQTLKLPVIRSTRSRRMMQRKQNSEDD